MHCSKCQTRFLWSKAPAVGSGGCWFGFGRKHANSAAKETVQVATAAVAAH